MTLGTRIAILNEGKLVQFDTPRRIYREPANRFVAEFVGRPAMNTIDGVVADGLFRSGDLELMVPGRPDGPVVLGIRPEHIVLNDASLPDSSTLELEVVELVEPDTLLFFRNGAKSMVARVMRDVADLAPGSAVPLGLPSDHRHFFDARTGDRLA